MGVLPAGGFWTEDTNAPATARRGGDTPAPPPPAPEFAYEPDRRRCGKPGARRAAHSKWNICVDLQMVAMEEAKALDLIPDLQSEDQTKVDAAWTKLQGMIKAREAILLAWPMVRTIDHSRAVSESIAEQRYPTEFEPPFTAVPDRGAAHFCRRCPGGKAGSRRMPFPPLLRPATYGSDARSREPTVLDDGKRVHIEICVPQRVELLEMEKNESLFANGRVIVEVPQPLFATSKTTLSLTLMNGQRQLVGVHKLSEASMETTLSSTSSGSTVTRIKE